MHIDEYNNYYSRNIDLEDVLKVAGSLPSMPSVASKALELIDNPNVTTSELAEMLSKDAGLTTRLLKIANSAAFSQQQKVTGLHQATSVVGLSGMRSLILASVMRGANSRFGELEKMVWQNALATAIACRYNRDWFKAEPTDDLFLYGLLHNLGQLVLLDHSECSKVSVIPRASSHAGVISV